MAVSANYDWNPEWDTVLRMGLQLAGLVPLGKSANAPQIAHARFFLDSFLKSMRNDVVRLSQREPATLALAVGVQAYDLPSDTIEIDFPVMLAAPGETTETQVDRMSYDGFEEIPDKQTTGRPLRLYVERLAVVSLRFWPVPDQAYSMSYRRRRLTRNADSGTTPDMVPGWIRGVAFQLAADMGRCGSMDASVIKERQEMADRLLGDARKTEHDETDLQFILPDLC